MAAFGREGSPGLTPSPPVTNGCTRGAEEGNSRNIQGARVLRSVPRPTLPGPPVAGVARRRRGGWCEAHIGFAKPSREKADSGWPHQSTWFAVRRPRPREGRVTTATKREEGCGPRHDAKIEARGCARTSLFHRLQKSIGDHCRPHRSSSTGHQAGPIVRWAGSERGPSPRRRTLLTREKSRTEAEPRVKQASRDAGPMRGCAHRGLGSRPALVSTAAHEGGAKSHSRHGGPNA